MPANVPSADPRPRQGKSRQQGFALLIMLIIVVIGSLYAVTGQLEFASRKYARDEATFRTLTLAKEALLGYAATYRDTHNGEVFGYLPCPSTYVGADPAQWGTADSSCAASAIGLLPYKTLGLPDLRDADGNCLWYALSGSFKNFAQVPPLNWDTQGQFTITGMNVAPDQGDGGAAAVILAPGAAINGHAIQDNGPCQVNPSGNGVVGTYLESYNSATSTFTPGVSGTANNDLLTWITPKEIFDKVVKRQDFSNPLAATPAGQINKLTDEIKAVLEKNIQDDLLGISSAMQPADKTGFTQYSKQIGKLPAAMTLNDAINYGNYYTNWAEQYRQVMCTSLTTPCLAVAGTGCRGALMFGGRTSSGQPRPSAQKLFTPLPLGTTNLSYYFESGSGLNILNSVATTFSGVQAYTATSPSADLGTCLFPGNFVSFAQDIGSFTRVYSSFWNPEAVINVAAKTVTLGDPAATSAGRGCVWYPAQLSFNSSLRAYFKMNFANFGEGFMFAVVDGPNNQAAMTGGTLCGSTTGALMGYSSASVSDPKFGVEIDTRSTTTANCTGSNRNDPGSNHMALVYWGTAASASDDNCHNAGTLGSGSEPLNPRTLTTSSATVQSATWAGNVASITTTATHGLASNQQVTIAGMVPTIYNGNYQVAVVDATHLAYSLTGPASSVTLSTVSSASWSGGVITVGTSAAHGLTAGTQVIITGIAPAGYNGTYSVITVSDATHFTYAQSVDPGAYTSGGTVIPGGRTVATVVGIQNVQASDPDLPYAGSLPLNTNIHVRLDVNKTFDATLIQAASWSANSVSITTAAPHGLQSNQRVTISASNPAGYNGTYTITVTDSTHFTYPLGANPGSYTASGLIRPPLGVAVQTASQAASGVAFAATITTAAAHGFVSGQPVSISGVTPAAYNGTYQIVVVDATHFSYALGADPGAYTSGGALTAAVALTLKAYVNSNFLQVSGASWSASTASITTSTSHGLVSGQSVKLSNVIPAAYNGTYQIVVTSPTTFTYVLGANPGAYSSGGDVNCKLADLQNLSRDLSSLCAQNPTLEQDNVYMDVDAVTGKALATIFAGFTNAQGSASASEQTVTISNFIIKTQ